MKKEDIQERLQEEVKELMVRSATNIQGADRDEVSELRVEVNELRGMLEKVHRRLGMTSSGATTDNWTD